MSDLALVSFADLIDLNPRPQLASTQVHYIGMEDVSEDGQLLRTTKREFQSITIGQPSFEDHDVLFAKITPCMENGKGAYVTGLRGAVGCGSTEFHVLRAKPGIHPRFIYHWTRSDTFRRRAELMMSGSAGQRRVPSLFFSRFQVPVLPFADQERIVEILDTLTEVEYSIDAAIAKTRLIRGELLHLLTRRQGWPERPLGDVATITSGSTPSRTSAEFWSAGRIPWVKTAEISFSVISDTSERVTQSAVAAANLKIFPKNTVLVAMYGEGVTRGRSAILGVDATINQAAAAISCDPTMLDYRYLYYWLESSYSDIRKIGQGSNQKNLSASLLGGMKLPVPSLADQRQVVQAVLTFDARLSLDLDKRTKLRKLKQGLADDLLTGHVRVDGAAAA